MVGGRDRPSGERGRAHVTGSLDRLHFGIAGGRGPFSGRHHVPFPRSSRSPHRGSSSRQRPLPGLQGGAKARLLGSSGEIAFVLRPTAQDHVPGLGRRRFTGSQDRQGCGSPRMLEWIKNTASQLRTKWAQTLAKACMEGDPKRWWHEISRRGQGGR